MPAKTKDPMTQRMLPPEKRAPEPPPPFEDLLPSGLMAQWRMPDPFAVVAFDGVIPDPLTAAVIQLLKDEKSYTADADPRKFRYDAQNILGMYALAGAMLEKPTLDPTREYGDGDVLGRRELGYKDACHLYALFLFFSRPATARAADPTEPERPTNAASDREGVPPDPSAADADS